MVHHLKGSNPRRILLCLSLVQYFSTSFQVWQQLSLYHLIQSYSFSILSCLTSYSFTLALLLYFLPLNHFSPPGWPPHSRRRRSSVPPYIVFLLMPLLSDPLPSSWASLLVLSGIHFLPHEPPHFHFSFFSRHLPSLHKRGSLPLPLGFTHHSGTPLQSPSKL